MNGASMALPLREETGTDITSDARKPPKVRNLANPLTPLGKIQMVSSFFGMNDPGAPSRGRHDQ